LEEFEQVNTMKRKMTRKRMDQARESNEQKYSRQMQDTHLEICSWLQTLPAALLGGLRLRRQQSNTRCGGPRNTLFSGSVETLFCKELRRLAARRHTAGLPPASEPKTSYI